MDSLEIDYEICIKSKKKDVNYPYLSRCTFAIYLSRKTAACACKVKALQFSEVSQRWALSLNLLIFLQGLTETAFFIFNWSLTVAKAWALPKPELGSGKLWHLTKHWSHSQRSQNRNIIATLPPCLTGIKCITCPFCPNNPISFQLLLGTQKGILV